MHKSIPILLLSAALVAVPASARDGRDLAGAFLGGVIVGELANQASRPVERVYYNSPPARVYYEEAAPRVYYSEPTTVYYSAPPVIRVGPSVRYIENRTYWRNDWHGGHYHGGHHRDW